MRRIIKTEKSHFSVLSSKPSPPRILQVLTITNQRKISSWTNISQIHPVALAHDLLLSLCLMS